MIIFFSLISLVEEDQEIPNGYEGKSIVDEYWFPNLIEFKNLYLELNHKETQIKCETQDGYKELQKKIYYFMSDMIETIGV